MSAPEFVLHCAMQPGARSTCRAVSKHNGVIDSGPEGGCSAVSHEKYRLVDLRL
jgi:hypothetical protein